jgi:hypothetical protein
MKRWILACMSVAVVSGGFAATAWADDLVPPPWRGSSRTTWQDWTFATDANPTAPEGFINANGTPSATITDGTWLSAESDHVGVWQLTQPDSKIDLSIPNYSYRPNEKVVWTQVTWSSEGGVPDVLVSTARQGTTYTYSGELVSRTPLNNYSLNNEGYSWYQDVVQTIIPYNPSHENVVITGNIDCGQVVVDTVCPEPSSIVLLGIGAISLLAYAWRRRRQTV